MRRRQDTASCSVRVEGRGWLESRRDPRRPCDPPAARPPRVRVVVVDGDPRQAHALGRALARAGATVIAVAESPYEALVAARRHAPDIAFVAELLAPGTDSLALIEIIDGLDLGIRPIMMADGRSAEDALAALRAGARGYVGQSELVAAGLPRLLAAAMANELICSRTMTAAILLRLLQPRRLGAIS